ncbi:TPA: glycosyltransferase family 2 protein [Candidatus Woesearchaeota archaeon]|nr:glycosyltransferase family 2 protein [Candidatus Woesearchaeota archaeon]HIH48003.1 glycosyltransferase family 2 protein [Candidatus Woesearchaeota archaeon]HIJ18869.1 glycosyltransferase family 2 protein [Candidatus Woesearchaeota archaeon]
MKIPELSIVLPIYNEEENILPLYGKLKKALARLKKSHEILFVDDGSTDKGLERLRELKRRDRTVRIIVFRKNFGQSAAMSAGFSQARGKIIIVMDADLQNDPDDISRLLNKMKEGYEVVSGWRHSRNDPASKRLPSRISNWLHRRLTGLDIHDSGCSLKAYNRESVKGLELYGEMHRYIPALIAAKGFRIGEVQVQHHERTHGKSKYGGGRLLRGFLDLLFIHFMTKYSSRPLHFFGYLGIIPILLGLLLGVYKTIDQLMLFLSGGDVVASPLLLLSVFLILMGVLLIIFGFLAELLIRMHYQSTEGKNYSIREIL